jgi:hypothetical protein
METPTPSAVDRFLIAHPRLGGVVLLAIGLLIAKWQIYDPLHAAERHVQHLEIYQELVALAVLFSVGGVLLVLFGPKKIKEWFVINPKNLSLKHTLILLSTAGVCLAVFFYVLGELAKQGYTVKF